MSQGDVQRPRQRPLSNTAFYSGLIYDQIVEAIYRTRHAAPDAVAEGGRSGALSIPTEDVDYKEMRVDLATFKHFLAEVATWARDEYVISNGFQERSERKMPENNEVATRLFKHWDSEKRGTLSLQVRSAPSRH